MAAISAHSHSFDTALAALYGIEESILINYFQHWIKKNKLRNRNFHDGRTWMYETQEDMAANFPYMNRLKVLRVIKNLVKRGVLMKGNYNKAKYDQTSWYAFVEEGKFVDSSGIVQKCTMESSQVNNGKFTSEQPIPVTNTVTNTYKEKEKNKEKEVGGKPPAPPSASPHHSPSARDLFSLFLGKLKEKNPQIKEPNESKWLREFDLLLRVDKRDLEITKKLIEWASSHEFWGSTCLSPTNLRKSYDRMLMQMQAQITSTQEPINVSINKKHVVDILKKYPHRKHLLELHETHVLRPGVTDVSLNMAPNEFADAFLRLLGGSYEG